MTISFDGDALVYIAGFAADSRNGPFSHSAHNIKLIINKVLKELDEEDFRVFLTSTDPTVNFRTEVSDKYKKNRAKFCKPCWAKDRIKSTYSKESFVVREPTKTGTMKRRAFTCDRCSGNVYDTKPVYYNKIRNFLKTQYGATVCEWGEADDWLGVGLKKTDYIATHDKDLKMIPCKYYNLKSGEVSEHSDPGEIYLDEQDKLKGFGFKWFCVQMITGDTADNIMKPCKGDGPKRFIIPIFGPLTTMEEAWKMVELYYNNTGNGHILWDQAKLLWISRKKFQLGTKETIYSLIKGK